MLTPEEFVEAGDQLVRTSPTWQWYGASLLGLFTFPFVSVCSTRSGGDESKRRDYLPAKKQFLVTKNVPCLRRVSAITSTKTTDVELENDWVATDLVDREQGARQELGAEAGAEGEGIDTIEADGAINEPSTVPTESPSPPEECAASRSPLTDKPSEPSVVEEVGDDFVDLDEFVDDTLADDFVDKATVSRDELRTYGGAETEAGNVVKARSYTLSITYDKFYQTPRVFMQGFDAESLPLTDEQLFEDIMQDYQNKTVTIERHPHLLSKIHQASIHRKSPLYSSHSRELIFL